MKSGFLLFLFFLVILDSSFAQSVQLNSFIAKADSIRGNVIIWTTDRETNNDYFEIQRSYGDLTKFESIGQVLSKGNSTIRQDYEFIDDVGTETDLAYYRLKMVDKTGAFNYSHTLALRQMAKDDPSLIIYNVYPGPGTEYLQIKLTNRHIPVLASIYDLRGIIVSKQSILVSNVITVKSLPEGLYVLEVASATGQIVRKRFYR